ncbi:hypothetical protein NYE69_28270 [Paenibacillus sp. FSL R5-0527]|uniref:hypothetical protein n=1 Tax=Paenibacillus sp. FSL R5-0527 TaxID=2975321 RepID=UPI00097A3669|nr:hypothetical protein BK140_11135 [Paenibacillus macerans]
MQIIKKWWVWAIALVVLVSGVLIGKSLYEQKKEADRQALIHMGDKLDEAWNKYEKETAKINENGKLASEYTELMMDIVDGNIPANEIEEATEKACKMEKELMEIYPTVYKEPSSVCKDKK